MPIINKNITEEELIKLLRSRNKDGIDLLYDKYAPALFGVVLKIVGSEELARDILQESFVKIWLNFHSYKEEKGRLFTWILNIARNKAIDTTRSKNFKLLRHNEQLSSVDAKKALTIKTDHIGLKDIVEKLSPEMKTVIETVYFKGYTHAEAAEFLELPLGTVKTRVRNGLKALRKLMN